MSRLIDRADLFNSIANARTVGEIFAAIQDAPSVNGGTAKRGAWKRLPDGSCKCSECGWEELYPLLSSSRNSNYCPNCGTKMERNE